MKDRLILIPEEGEPMKAEFLWEVFTETGAPEAYLLYKDAGRAASAMSKREAAYVPDDTGACPPDNRI